MPVSCRPAPPASTTATTQADTPKTTTASKSKADYTTTTTTKRRRRRLTLPPRKAKHAVSAPKRYRVAAVVGIRRSNTYTDDAPSFQYAIKWDGYEDVTWHLPTVLDIYDVLTETLTIHMDPANDRQNGNTALPFYAAQPAGEEDGAVLGADDLVLAHN